MKREDEGRLRDVLESALLIQKYLAGMGFDDFAADLRTQDAVIRRLEIMGEAAGHLSEEARSSFPSIPFQQIRGMRNILAHDYGEVNLLRVWSTIHADLPKLIATLQPHFPMLASQLTFTDISSRLDTP